MFRWKRRKTDYTDVYLRFMGMSDGKGLSVLLGKGHVVLEFPMMNEIKTSVVLCGIKDCDLISRMLESGKGDEKIGMKDGTVGE